MLARKPTTLVVWSVKHSTTSCRVVDCKGRIAVALHKICFPNHNAASLPLNALPLSKLIYSLLCKILFRILGKEISAIRNKWSHTVMHFRKKWLNPHHHHRISVLYLYSNILRSTSFSLSVRRGKT